MTQHSVQKAPSHFASPGRGPLVSQTCIERLDLEIVQLGLIMAGAGIITLLLPARNMRRRRSTRQLSGVMKAYLPVS